MNRRLVAVAAAVIALLSCGQRMTPLGEVDSGTGGGAQGGGSATGGGYPGTGGGSASGGGLEQNAALALCTSLMTVRCAFNARCFQIDQAQCAAGESTYCESVASAVASGRQAIDMAQLTACSDQLTADTACDLTALPSCTSVFEPLTARGSSCSTSSDCAPTVIARPEYGGIFVDPAGDHCGDNTACPATCGGGGQVGEPCTAITGFGSPYACAPGLWCDANTIVCRAPLALGTACSNADNVGEFAQVCGPGAECDQLSSTCLALPDAGTPAQAGQPCADNGCALGLVCDTDQTCKAPRVRQLGERCGGLDQCLFELITPPRGACDESLHVCVAFDHPAGAGDACGSVQHCNAMPCHGLVLHDDGGITPGICGTPATGESCAFARTPPSFGLTFPQCRTGEHCAQADGGLGDSQVGERYEGSCQSVVSGGLCISTLDCPATEDCAGDFESPGNCKPRNIAEGVSCTTSSAFCALGLSCIEQIGGDGLCRHVAAAGETCTVALYDSDRCLPGLTCVAGNCRLAGTPGGACDPTLGCSLGICDAGMCFAPQAGGACTVDSECASFRCRGGQCVAACE